MNFLAIDQKFNFLNYHTNLKTRRPFFLLKLIKENQLCQKYTIDYNDQNSIILLDSLILDPKK